MSNQYYKILLWIVYSIFILFSQVCQDLKPPIEVLMCGPFIALSSAVTLKKLFKKIFTFNTGISYLALLSLSIAGLSFYWPYITRVSVKNSSKFWHSKSTTFHDFLTWITLFASFGVVTCLSSMDDELEDCDLIDIEKDTESIGAFWSEQAYNSYFEPVLSDIKTRMQKFEEKHPLINIALKKLILIIPLSCDIRGTLDQNPNRDKNPNIKYIDVLPVIECDQGGNINREYKNPVYQITQSNGEKLYIAAELPNSLLTLWTVQKNYQRDYFPRNWFIYQRDCFIKVLKHLVKDNPCIVLTYDDEDKDSLSLDKFLIHEINKILKENVEVDVDAKI